MKFKYRFDDKYLSDILLYILTIEAKRFSTWKTFFKLLKNESQCSYVKQNLLRPCEEKQGSYEIDITSATALLINKCLKQIE